MSIVDDAGLFINAGLLVAAIISTSIAYWIYRKKYPSGVTGQVQALSKTVSSLGAEVAAIKEKMVADDSETQLIRGELETNKALSTNIAQRLEIIADRTDGKFEDLSDKMDTLQTNLGARIDRIFERLGDRQ